MRGLTGRMLLIALALVAGPAGVAGRARHYPFETGCQRRAHERVG